MMQLACGAFPSTLQLHHHKSVLCVVAAIAIFCVVMVALTAWPRDRSRGDDYETAGPDHESTRTRTLEARFATPSAISSTLALGGSTGSWLIAMTGGSSYRVRGRLVVGRAPGCEIRFSDRHISRRHFELREADGVCTIIDLGSRNGVYVNDARVHRLVLADNDVVCVGRRFFRFKSVH